MMDSNEALNRIRGIQPHSESGPYGISRRNEKARSRVQATVECQPQKAWAEAKGQPLRFPRPCLLGLRYFAFIRTDQLLVGETLPYDLGDQRGEPIRIVHFDPIVEAESLFVNIAEQVIRFHRNVGSVDTTLQQAPEVLHAVGVNLPVNVGFGMVNNLVLKVIAKASYDLSASLYSADPASTWSRTNF